MKKKEDLRVRKTKANLYKGLVKMLEEKQFEDIKIIDICKRSNVNRSTFYDHFNDKYELLSSYLKDVSTKATNNLTSNLENKKYKNAKDYYFDIIKIHLDYINNTVTRNATLKIIQNNLHSIASDMLIDYALDTVTKNLKENYHNDSNIPIEIIASFYINAANKVCLQYIAEHEFKEKQLFEYLEKLIPDLDYLKPIN